MEFKRHEDAKLTGYQGPFFPDKIDQLNNACDLHGWYDETILKIAQSLSMPGTTTGMLTTSDQYTWADSIILDFEEGKVSILIPFLRDLEGLDRSIAFYAKGNIIPEQIDAVLNDILDVAKALN